VQPLPPSPPPTPQPPSGLPKRAWLPLIFNNYLTVDGRPAQLVKYYLVGGQRIASRAGSTGAVTYYYHDHLGSTVASSAGESTRYWPYGATRGGSVGTAYQFTGQRREVGLGVYFFQARWYDPVVGRFVQPDTIVPEPGDPQSLNRYSYVKNNPLRYVDSNGHCGPLTPVCLGLLLGGMALLLQGDSPDLNITPEDVASQRLGGALIVGGATLYGGSALAGTVGATQAGTMAATTACADGDCTNEVQGVGQVVQNAAKAAESGSALRQQYENAVRALSEKAAQMRATGKSAEEIARSLSAERRALGERFKAMTPPDALEQIYARNLERYGDRLGPTVEWLVEQGLRQGKSMEQIWESIVEKASRPGGGDIIPKLLNK
jgi:RHS repeat-associated protein